MKKLLASLAALITFLLILMLPGPAPLLAAPCLTCTEYCNNINYGWDGSTYWTLDLCYYDGCGAGDPGHMLRYMNSNGVIQYWPY